MRLAGCSSRLRSGCFAWGNSLAGAMLVGWNGAGDVVATNRLECFVTLNQAVDEAESWTKFAVRSRTLEVGQHFVGAACYAIR